MSEATPRYTHELHPPDYRHDLHAGNIGDVWKHVVLAALVPAVQRHHRAVTFLDTHGGRGSYELAATGEWTEAAGRLGGTPPAPAALARYLEALTTAGFFARSGRRRYPGSPLLFASWSRPEDRVIVCESDGATCAALGAALAGRGNTSWCHEDGFDRLAAEASRPGDLCVLVDPPWHRKADWQEIPAHLMKAVQGSPGMVLALWYPIKSYTRIQAMMRLFRGLTMPCHRCDLLTTSLESKKNRLNGSGMLLVNAPPEVLPEIAAAGAVAGERCATAGYWRLEIEVVNGAR